MHVSDTGPVPRCSCLEPEESSERERERDREREGGREGGREEERRRGKEILPVRQCTFPLRALMH